MDWILTIDVGNSNIVAGCFPAEAEAETGRPSAVCRFGTRRDWTAEELARELAHFLEKQSISGRDIAGSILSSVVPELNDPLSEAAAQLTGRRPLLMRHELETGIRDGGYDLPHVGTDRLVDMAAAVQLYGTPVAVWDLGTATTLSVVNRDRVFVGGMICAGVQLGLNALAQQAAQLPALEAASPAALLGLDTESCMQSGAAAAAGILIGGTADRLEQRPDLAGLTVVVTGGHGGLAIPWIGRKAVYDPDLLLKGLLIIYRKNAAAPR